jgi:hypothetical protein
MSNKAFFIQIPVTMSAWKKFGDWIQTEPAGINSIFYSDMKPSGLKKEKSLTIAFTIDRSDPTGGWEPGNKPVRLESIRDFKLWSNQAYYSKWIKENAKMLNSEKAVEDFIKKYDKPKATITVKPTTVKKTVKCTTAGRDLKTKKSSAAGRTLVTSCKKKK